MQLAFLVFIICIIENPEAGNRFIEYNKWGDPEDITKTAPFHLAGFSRATLQVQEISMRVVTAMITRAE
jgi:hypothetical protein